MVSWVMIETEMAEARASGPEGERDNLEGLSYDPNSPFFAPNPPPVRIEFGAISHCGSVRVTNEDQYLVVRRRRGRDVLLTSLPDGSLASVEQTAYAMVVADGIGGAAFGQVASALALRFGFELGLNEIKWPLHVTEKEILEVLDKLDEYGQVMHRRILEQERLEPALAGMGTTVTVAYT